MSTPRAAIVDYGLGNLFSISQACLAAGLEPVITDDARVLADADGIVLPGVGAFGDAVASLHRLDLFRPLQDLGAAGVPLLGVCLGLQLLLSESQEFGTHRGLNLVPGTVIPLKPQESVVSGVKRRLKVPQIGWNRVWRHAGSAAGGGLLDSLPDGSYMYFIHSYYAVLEDRDVVSGTTRYGGLDYCSVLTSGSIFGCQFHPERSGDAGLTVYRNFARTLIAREGLS